MPSDRHHGSEPYTHGSILSFLIDPPPRHYLLTKVSFLGFPFSARFPLSPSSQDRVLLAEFSLANRVSRDCLPSSSLNSSSCNWLILRNLFPDLFSLERPSPDTPPPPLENSEAWVHLLAFPSLPRPSALDSHPRGFWAPCRILLSLHVEASPSLLAHS